MVDKKYIFFGLLVIAAHLQANTIYDNGSIIEKSALIPYSKTIKTDVFNKQVASSRIANSSHSHYEKLGLTEDATPQEIKRAYRKLAVTVHPDKTHDSDTAFKSLGQSYEILHDPKQKFEYDNQLINQKIDILEQQKETVKNQADQDFLQDSEVKGTLIWFNVTPKELQEQKTNN